MRRQDGTLRTWMSSDELPKALKSTMPSQPQRKKLALSNSEVAKDKQRRLEMAHETKEEYANETTELHPTKHPDESNHDFAGSPFKLKLPPMPISHSALQEAPPTWPPKPRLDRSMFGFGELPQPPKPATSPRLKKKRKLIVNTSSPTASPGKQQDSRVLVPPSTPSLLCANIPLPSPPSSITYSPLASAGKARSLPSIVGQNQKYPGLSNDQQSPEQGNANRKRRSGTRITWDTQDESEAIRLNQTSSASCVEALLLGRPSHRMARLPRCPPSVHFSQEKTGYMDRYQDEEDSPVQYTLPEAQMNDLRRLNGMSPVFGRRKKLEVEAKKRRDERRKTRQEQEQERNNFVVEVKEGVTHNPYLSDNDRIGAVSTVMHKRTTNNTNSDRQGTPFSVTLDNNATEQTPHSPRLQSTHTSNHATSPLADYNIAACQPSQSTLDLNDFGYLDAVSLSLHNSSVFTAANVSAIDSQNQKRHFKHLSNTSQPQTICPKPYSRCFSKDQRISDAESLGVLDLQDSVLDSQDEEDGDSENLDQLSDLNGLGYTCVGKTSKVSSRVLAPDTQDVLAFATQEVCADETQFSIHPLANKNSEYPMTVPSLQEEGHGHIEADEDLSIGGDAQSSSMLSEANNSANLAMLSKRPASRSLGVSIEDRISPAWFGDVLYIRPAPDAQIKDICQTTVTDFFARKPRAASERAAQEKEKCELAFMNTIAHEVESRSKVAFMPATASASYCLASEDRPNPDEVINEDEAMDENEGDVDTLDYTGEELQTIPSSQTQLDDLEDEDDELPDGFNPSKNESGRIKDVVLGSQVLSSDGEEQDIDTDASITSCESWVEGKSEQIPSPVKRAKLQRMFM